MKKKAYKKSIAFITAMLMTFGTVSAVPSEYLPTIRVSAEESTSEGIAVDENNFPDPVFRAYLLSNANNKDDPAVLSQSEINNISRIDLENSEVKSLQGIEYLTAVTAIYCYNSSLTTLKLNDNKMLKLINVSGCQLTSLDLSNNPNLTTIFCQDNNLTELNVNGCTALSSLYFSNNKLESIDLSDNNALTHLMCNNNQLKELDLSGKTNLMFLECSGNQLNSLDITNVYDSSLSLVCDNNSSEVPSENNCIAISELEKYGFDPQKVTEWVDCTYDPENDRIIAHHPIISYIYKIGSVHIRTFTLTLADYKGTEINETNFPDEAFRDYILTKDTDDDNMLSEKEKSEAAIIRVDNKGIQSLKGIEFFKDHLKNLYCYGNQLTELDISQNTQLTELRCYKNQLTKLDVSQNNQLTNLNCYNNQLTELDVSANTQLTNLNCYNNQLTELDVSANTQLTNLICYNNQLTELNVSANTQLTNLDCADNQLT
ncbi:MAG: hypothetical protein IJ446_03180, partial [Oscillospiraceae bacterium]|nr:hypothetical protein [Oscillospiraceae bacterium]